MSLIGFIVATGLSFLLGLLFTPFVIGIAIRWKICEKPNGRTNRDIAHIGGVAIIGAILFTLIPVFLFILPDDLLHNIFLPLLIAGGFLIFFLGIIDDLRSLHYLYKLVVQVAVSVFVSAGGLVMLEHFGVAHFSISAAIAAFGAAGFWVLVVTTSFNLIDGLDGLASGISIISSAAFVLVGMLSGQPLVVALSLVILGSTLAFLRYNFPPAKIFMGDSGSLFLGLLFALLSLLVVVTGRDFFYRAAGCALILSIPLIDTALAFLRRLLLHRPVFEADYMHLHHILLYRLRSVKRVDFFLWGFSMLLGMLGILTVMGNLPALLLALAADVLVFFLAFRRMVNFDLPDRRTREILRNSGVTTTRMVAQQDLNS